LRPGRLTTGREPHYTLNRRLGRPHGQFGLLGKNVWMFIYSNTVIQGVSRLVDVTAGGDFLGLCDQKSSYKRVRFWIVTGLWAYFNSHTRPRVNRILWNQPAGDVLSLVAYRLRKLRRATCAVHNRAAACFAAGIGIFENQL